MAARLHGKAIACNRGAYSFRDLKSPAKTGAGHDNHEFVAAKPAQEIGFADDLFRASGEAFQNAISGGVAMPIVDRFETVEIENHRAKRASARPIEKRAETGFEVKGSAAAISIVVSTSSRRQSAYRFRRICVRTRAEAVGLVCEAVPDGMEPEELLLSAGSHSMAGKVKICQEAYEKSKTAPFSAALDFRASEGADDPLRQAALLTIALALDVPQ